MPGSYPNCSNLYPELDALLKSRAGNNNPLSMGGVSGLSTWIRLVSAVSPNGLIMESIHDSGGDFNTNYGSNGTYKGSGILGHNFSGDEVMVKNGMDRALRPSPIITSMTMDEKAEAGSRLATVKITAFTLKQAEVLSEYFLEGGFHILCEWGWNVKESVSQKCSGGGKTIDKCDIVAYDNWGVIKTKRQNSGFTYDAFLGIVTGGGISFGDNETYELEIKITSVGNVAEYMQTHRDANKKDQPTKDSSLTFSSQDIDSALGSKNLGRALFMQMFNELPGQKRTQLVKKLVDNPYWSAAANYVNMDKVVREELADTLSDAPELKSQDATKEAKIPKDIPLVTEDRYIRFELACEIINTYPINLKPQSSGCNKKSRDQRIKIQQTLCSGFPHMFSTDKSKLFIPNTTAPNFKLLDALSSTTELKDFIIYSDLNNEANLANLHPLTDINTYDEKLWPNGSKKDFAMKTNRPVPYAFPATYALEVNRSKVDSSFDTIIEEPYFWGYLKNLYINFDFFIECISKPNFVIRDVLYEMLNGMSAACNSIWRFQILENPNLRNGDLELSVVDLNFSGQVMTDGVTELQARGVESPFVSCDFSVEVPQAMMSSQVQKKLNSKFEHSPELNPRPMKGNVWSNREDMVGTILQGLKVEDKEQEVTKDANAPAPSKSKDELEDEARTLNYEYYTKTGAVLPKIQDRNGKLDITKTLLDFKSSNDVTIEELFMVGAWNDSAALRQVFLVDKGIAKGGGVGRSNDKNNKQNPPFGLATFNFRVHGVSGFKVGDKFRIDGLPKQFGAPNFFQVVKVDHTIDGMNWWTDIEGQLRIIGDEK
jgi:hypothetical protein